MILASDRKGYLISLWQKAQNGNVSLYSVLQLAISNLFQDANEGSYVVATSGNGRSTQIFMPDWIKTMTRDDVRHLHVDLFNLYRASYRWQVDNNVTVTVNGTPFTFTWPIDSTQTAGDQTIFDCMIEDRTMQRITESYNDWTNFYLAQLNFRGCPEGVTAW